MPPPSDPSGPTGKLCDWLYDITLDDVPPAIRTRAKYLILDGLGCALVGARLPWSETAVKSVLELENRTPDAGCSIVGWEERVGPLPAALLNSTFIQGFELDDYHSEAPLHSNSLLLPALLAATEHTHTQPVDGKSFLLSAITGYEVGPRIGLALHGTNILTVGWHSGSVFGPAAVAASVGKLLRLEPNAFEDAIGIACTQACGLMSAQFKSMVKRMQHGFASRNGLLAAFLARSGYTGIQQVFEQPWGGFLSTFGQGSGKEPLYKVDEVTRELGKTWQIEKIRVKPYAALAATHAAIDCIVALQERHLAHLEELESIRSITIEMSEPAFKRGGWTPVRPLPVTGAQMNTAFVVASQLVDKQVLLQQFREDRLDRNIVWDLIGKTICKAIPEFAEEGKKWNQRVTIEFSDSRPSLDHLIRAPKGIEPAMSNEDILVKWRNMTKEVIDQRQRVEIEEMIMNLESVKEVAELGRAMAGSTQSRI